MSNRAWNELKVYGSQEQLAEFITNVESKTKVFDVDKIIPVAKGQDCKEAHGCRWTDGEWLRGIEGGISYTFESAWNEPHKVLDKLFTDYPHLHFIFDAQETLAGWYLVVEAKDGKVIKQQHYEMNFYGNVSVKITDDLTGEVILSRTKEEVEQEEERLQKIYVEKQNEPPQINDVQKVALSALSKMLGRSEIQMIVDVLGSSKSVNGLTYEEAVAVIKHWNEHYKTIRKEYNKSILNQTKKGV